MSAAKLPGAYFFVGVQNIATRLTFTSWGDTTDVYVPLFTSLLQGLGPFFSIFSAGSEGIHPTFTKKNNKNLLTFQRIFPLNGGVETIWSSPPKHDSRLLLGPIPTWRHCGKDLGRGAAWIRSKSRAGPTCCFVHLEHMIPTTIKKQIFASNICKSEKLTLEISMSKFDD